MIPFILKLHTDHSSDLVVSTQVSVQMGQSFISTAVTNMA